MLVKSKRKGKFESRQKPGRSSVAAPTSRVWPRPVSWLIPTLVALVTFAAFLPTLHNGFVNLDDEKLLIDNTYYRGLGREQLWWMFTTFHMSLYRPLTWVTFGLDYLIWGMDPFGYHLSSLLIHVANALLFYLVALRLLALSLSGAVGKLVLRAAAGFAALVFAVHPLRVEAVAWLAARNDLVSGLFFLLTILLYLRAVTLAKTHPLGWRWMAATMGVYGLSLLSKAAGIMLPFVLLVLDVYPLRRLGGDPRRWFAPEVRRVWWEKVPFVILAVAAAVVAVMAKQETAMKSLVQHNFGSRTIQALFGLAFYLWKTILPLRLSPLYELPVHFNPWDRAFLAGGMSVLAISIILLVVRHRWPVGLSNWVCYVAILAPVLGLAQSGPQLVADRYSYLACLGWAVLAGAGLYYCWRAQAQGAMRRWLLASAVGVAGLAVGTLGILTWQQTQIWHDSETLWRHALKIDHDSGWAYNSLGTALLRQQRLKEAVEQFRQATRVNPDYALAYYNLGIALTEEGDLDGAIRNYRQAVRLDPDFPKALNNLAIALATKGEFAEAMEQLQRALELAKGRAESYFNLANVFIMQGHMKEAVEYFERSLKIKPDFAEAYDRLGSVFAFQGRLNEAIQYFREAVRLDPESSEAHFNLANALVRQGNLDEAMEHFQRALQIRPGFAQAHNNLGRVMAARGDLNGAMGHFHQALRIRPDFSAAHESLAMALAEQGNRDEAIKHHQEALRIMNSGPKAGAPDKKGLLGFDIAR